MKRLLTLSLAALLAAGLTACGAAEERGDLAAKPVLYLYPEEETEVTVTLDFDGTLTSTYPDYGDGWTVTARPGGTLTDPATGREYYCLFWEGITDAEYDFSTGFCVAGEDTAAKAGGQPLQSALLSNGGVHKLRRFDHRPGPRHPDPGVPGVEGPGRAGGGGAPEADRAGARWLHRRGVGRRGGSAMKKLLLLLALTLLAAGLAGCGNSSGNVAVPEKPVLYLYPEEEMEVTVTLDFDGTLTSTYPAYGDGWTVTARPDGTLTNPATGREYYCLFWEGITEAEYDFSAGFCVAGEDTAAFLEDALDRLGLTEREADEFIIYWLPKLEGNPYNLLSFQTEAYTDSAGLTIDPAPDTLIRVFLAWKGLDAPVEVEPQTLTAPERADFTAVEWGGAEVD